MKIAQKKTMKKSMMKKTMMEKMLRFMWIFIDEFIVLKSSNFKISNMGAIFFQNFKSKIFKILAVIAILKFQMLAVFFLNSKSKKIKYGNYSLKFENLKFQISNVGGFF